MKRLVFVFLLIVLVMAALACRQPWQITPEMTEVVIETDVVTEEPPEALTGEPTEAPYACHADLTLAMAFSVKFCYPTTLFSGFSQTMISENPPSPDMPPWEVNPDMIEVTFIGYPVANLYHDPQVFVYPIDDFVALDPLVQGAVDELIILLETQPKYTDDIPHFPFYNAAQIMRAKITYFDFRNGRGMRYITQYSQGVVPVSNDSAIYAFIGITDDDQYLMTATFPVEHPLFSLDSMKEPAEGWEIFAQEFETYLENMELDLASETPDSFTPSLESLDEMMASFLIPVNTIP